jgi:hypothetical protein
MDMTIFPGPGEEQAPVVGEAKRGQTLALMRVGPQEEGVPSHTVVIEGHGTVEGGIRRNRRSGNRTRGK